MFGIGKRESGIEINLLLQSKNCNRGGYVKGKIVIKGENENSYFSRGIFIDLVSEKNGNIEKHGDYKIFDKFEVETKIKKEIEFEIILPEDGPFSEPNKEIFLISRLDLKKGNDPRDKDFINIAK